MERKNKFPLHTSESLGQIEVKRSLSSKDSLTEVVRIMPNPRKKLLQNPINQRKNGQRLYNVLLPFVRGPFQILKENMRKEKINSSLWKLGLVVQAKREAHMSAGFTALRSKMKKVRNALKMAAKLERLFKISLKSRQQFGFRKILQRSLAKYRNEATKRIQSLPFVLTRCFEKIKRRKLFEGYNRLKGIIKEKNNKLLGAKKIASNIKRYLRLMQAIALSKIISSTVLVETKKKHKRFFRTGSTTPENIQPIQQQRLLEIKQLKKQLQAQTKIASQLQNQLKSLKQKPAIHHSPPQPHNSRHRTSPPARENLSQLSQDNHHNTSRANSLASSRGRRSVYSDLSQNKSIFSLNTRNLLNKLQSSNLNPSSTGHCCKYKAKYNELNAKNKELERMLEMKDDECRMLEEINKHIEETIDRELGRVDQGGEAGHRVRELEAELAKVSGELEQVRKDREYQKKKFKKKLESILERMSKSKKE